MDAAIVIAQREPGRRLRQHDALQRAFVAGHAQAGWRILGVLAERPDEGDQAAHFGRRDRRRRHAFRQDALPNERAKLGV